MKTNNGYLETVELSNTELSQIEGGFEPITWGVVLAIAGLVAKLIDKVEANPDAYASAGYYNNDVGCVDPDVYWTDQL